MKHLCKDVFNDAPNNKATMSGHALMKPPKPVQREHRSMIVRSRVGTGGLVSGIFVRDDAMDEKQVLEFFRSLDKKGTGYVERAEFASAAGQFVGGAKFANDIFTHLDADGDGKMRLTDLISELRKFLRENSTTDGADGNAIIDRRRRSDTQLAWSRIVEAIGEPVVKKFLNNSGRKLEELYDELQTQGSSPELVNHFEGAFTCLLQDVKQIIDDNEKLKQMFNKEKESHMKRIVDLEEEMDTQVAKVQALIEEKERLKYEQEKKEMMEKMEAEMAEMRTHLKMIQKANTILTQNKEERNDYLKNQSSSQNHELRSTLSDTRTSLAVVHAEMARMKAEYETKCRELNSHQEVVMQYLDQHKQVQRQLTLLHEANKNLQDTNDSLLSVIETGGGRLTPYGGSRAGSDTNSSPSEIGYFTHPVRNAYEAALQNNLYEQINQSGAQYVIQRLMEDIDSGHSTLRDPVEYDCDPKSLQEELYTLSDTESALKSIESDDSKPSTKQSRRRILPKTESFQSVESGYEMVGDPDRTYKIVLAGDAAVGKSCFIHRFCKGKFEKRLGSTLGVDFQIKTIRIDEKNVALQLWDTAGQERFRSMTKTYFRRADGIVLLYDVTSEKSFLSIREWIQSINETTDKPIPVLICGNKVDLRDEARNMGVRCIDTKTGAHLACDYNAIFYETSSKTGEKIMEALIAISREMLLREDVEVQTSALTIAKVERKSCCS